MFTGLIPNSMICPMRGIFTEDFTMGGASLLLAFLGRVQYRNTSTITRGTAATGEQSISVSIVDFSVLLYRRTV